MSNSKYHKKNQIPNVLDNPGKEWTEQAVTNQANREFAANKEAKRKPPPSHRVINEEGVLRSIRVSHEDEELVEALMEQELALFVNKKGLTLKEAKRLVSIRSILMEAVSIGLHEMISARGGKNE